MADPVQEDQISCVAKCRQFVKQKFDDVFHSEWTRVLAACIAIAVGCYLLYGLTIERFTFKCDSDPEHFDPRKVMKPILYTPVMVSVSTHKLLKLSIARQPHLLLTQSDPNHSQSISLQISQSISGFVACTNSVTSCVQSAANMAGMSPVEWMTLVQGPYKWSHSTLFHAMHRSRENNKVVYYYKTISVTVGERVRFYLMADSGSTRYTVNSEDIYNDVDDDSVKGEIFNPYKTLAKPFTLELEDVSGSEKFNISLDYEYAVTAPGQRDDSKYAQRIYKWDPQKTRDEATFELGHDTVNQRNCMMENYVGRSAWELIFTAIFETCWEYFPHTQPHFDPNSADWSQLWVCQFDSRLNLCFTPADTRQVLYFTNPEVNCIDHVIFREGISLDILTNPYLGLNALPKGKFCYLPYDQINARQQYADEQSMNRTLSPRGCLEFGYTIREISRKVTRRPRGGNAFITLTLPFDTTFTAHVYDNHMTNSQYSLQFISLMGIVFPCCLYINLLYCRNALYALGHFLSWLLIGLYNGMKRGWKRIRREAIETPPPPAVQYNPAHADNNQANQEHSNPQVLRQDGAVEMPQTGEHGGEPDEMSQPVAAARHGLAYRHNGLVV